MKPSITLSGHSTSQERYTYGQHLLYGGGYAYGGRGSIQGFLGDRPRIMVIPLSTLGTLVSYSDSNYSYSDDRITYSGVPVGQSKPVLLLNESPRLSLTREI